MGYWTTANGKRHNVNLHDDLIKAMMKEGARFCWMKDTPGIKNEDNEMFYETTTEKNGDGQDQTWRSLREGITVIAENGQQVTGYIVHWVLNDGNETEGTDIQDWFIIQPSLGTSPTHYIVEKTSGKIVITEL